MARILVADNNVSDRIQILNALEPAGHRVLEVADGKEAIAIALERPPDCIVTELILFGLDGFKLIRTLREHGLDMPIIVQTSMTKDSMRDTCLNMGANAFLRKPVGAVTLAETVRELVAASLDARLAKVLEEPKPDAS